MYRTTNINSGYKWTHQEVIDYFIKQYCIVKMRNKNNFF